MKTVVTVVGLGLITCLKNVAANLHMHTTVIVKKVKVKPELF